MPAYPFSVVISPGLYYYCPPMQASFDLPAWVDPANIKWARITIDLDPVRPGLGHGCAVKTEVKLNGKTLSGKGDVCDIFTVDVPPGVLLRTGNKLVFDFVATPECAIGFIMGFWNARLDGEVEAPSPPQPSPIVPPSPTYYPTGAPPEEEECKVFGISIGRMPREQCSQMQAMFMLMFLGLGLVLVISLLRR